MAEVAILRQDGLNISIEGNCFFAKHIKKEKGNENGDARVFRHKIVDLCDCVSLTHCH